MSTVAGVFRFLPGLLQSLLALSNDATTRRDRPPNKPSIPDPLIEQTANQDLDRPTVIYTLNKSAQWLWFTLSPYTSLFLSSIQQRDYAARSTSQQTFDSRPPN